MPLELHRYDVPPSRADLSAREGLARVLAAGLWLLLLLVVVASCAKGLA